MPRKTELPPERRAARKRPRPSARVKAAGARPGLRLVRREHTLVYGMRLLPDQVVPEGAHVHVPLPHAGDDETLTLHQISGDVAEIRRKLLESIDAFFEIYGEG
jgi:hypothetical protein